MKYIRRKLSILIVLAILLLISFSSTNVSANAVIHETISSRDITSGVTHEKIVRFTETGWMNINILRVNLDDPNVKVDTIQNNESITKLTNTKALAQSSGAVAAINAGFFNWMKESGKGYPDGPVVESGRVVTAYSEYNRYNDSMATIAIDNSNNILYDFLKTNMEIVSPNAIPEPAAAPVTQYNRPSMSQYNDITLWSRKWSQFSVGTTPEFPDIIEMVVEEGIVKEIRKGLPAVEIPENGYVVITRSAYTPYIETNYQVGDYVTFNISTTPDWSKFQMAVSGSAILVKDGQIPSKFSYDVDGKRPQKRPRTAAGSSSDGKQLILVTVDGDNAGGSIGMNQVELAELMISLGAHNAINLDGGGSTTMVARQPATNNIQVLNSFSDGSLRSIANAIGVFSVSPPSELEGLIIDTVDSNMFVNTSREFTIRGYDKYLNPIEVDMNNVQWSVSDIEGHFNNNVFYPESEGIGTITATFDDISATIEIKSLASPSQLLLSDKTLLLTEKKSKALTVKGKDTNGYTVYINPSDVKWSIEGNIGKFDKNVFTATKNGLGRITASIGNTHSYCAVSVAAESINVVNGFEAPNGSFLSAPAGTPANYEISGEQKSNGKLSGKLTYDFTANLESTRAAYLVFSNDGVQISKNASSIGVWVYNDHENSNWLRAEVIDESGKKHAIDFAKTMNWAGWKFVEAPLDGIKSPSKLTRIYLAQVNRVPEAGSVFFDELSFKISTFPVVELDKLSKDTIPVDPDNKKVDFSKGKNSFKYSVFSGKSTSENLLENLLLIRLSDKVNTRTDGCAFLDGGNIKPNLFGTKSISVDKGYKLMDIENSRFIQLDTTNKGLRTSSTGQWQWFLENLKSDNSDNIFILMKNSPESFSDKLEGALFKRVINEYKEESGKNIWVIHKGSSDKSYMENGIKYLSTSGLDITGLNPDNAESVKYIEITVNGSAATYEFKPIIE